MSADVYLCGNAPHAAADVVLRTVAPCVAATPAAGGARGAYPLGRATRPSRKPRQPHPPFRIGVTVGRVPEPETIIDADVAAFLELVRRQADEDALLAAGLI